LWYSEISLFKEKSSKLIEKIQKITKRVLYKIKSIKKFKVKPNQPIEEMTKKIKSEKIK